MNPPARQHNLDFPVPPRVIRPKLAKPSWLWALGWGPTLVVWLGDPFRFIIWLRA